MGAPLRTRSVNVALIAEIAAWLVMAIGMWLYSFRFESHIPNFLLGPVLWPRVILGLIALCAIGLALQQGLIWRAGGKSAPGSLMAAALPREVALKLLATFALPLLYVWLLPRAGFFATTPFFVAGYMYVFGQRRPVHLIATSFSIYAVVAVVFTKFLFLPLPVGVWPRFYDFSNAVLAFLVNG